MSEEFEVVDVSEAGIDAVAPDPHEALGNWTGMFEHGLPPVTDDEGKCLICGVPVLYDATGAPIVKVVKVRDGVRDTKSK